MNEEKKPIIRRVEPGEEVVIKIPICCREGWDTCEHVTKKQRPIKKNIGL